MSPTAIFWPMILHVLLVFIVGIMLGIRRQAALKRGDVKLGQFKLRGNEPESTAVFSNNLMNQFETPVLFHVVCICLFVTAGVNILTVALAWLFILSRYAHAWVHLTSNNVLMRFNMFGIGLIVLFILWVAFALHIAGA